MAATRPSIGNSTGSSSVRSLWNMPLPITIFKESPHRLTQLQVEAPKNILSGAPWCRIYIGNVKRHEKILSCWILFTKDPQGKDKEYVYHQATHGQRASGKLIPEIIRGTVPQELKGDHYLWAARDLAKETWGERKSISELAPDQKRWDQAQKKAIADAKKRIPRQRITMAPQNRVTKPRETAISKRKPKMRLIIEWSEGEGEDGQPREIIISKETNGRKNDRKVSERGGSNGQKFASTLTQTTDSHRADTPEPSSEAADNVRWDDSAVEKAWLDFKQPCRDWVHARMGQLMRDK
ncbi:hypothetical protein OPT61_g5918 [Boeremia exigua]|uniref:Uncharacterized protein n=1 Tax=Boeremia exigua TaxID=749465 RepID=A0ACC2I8T7_9PLEO|nr:hypothetical protein OPT61_g5918 [Boeremia exigua]